MHRPERQSSPYARAAALSPSSREVPGVITKKQYAADWLRETIVSGDFPRGVASVKKEIADLLRMSSTPARETI